MVNKKAYIEGLILEAHACLGITDTKQKNIVKQAIEILNKIDVLIHDDDIKNQISTKKAKVQDGFEKAQEDIKKITDPFAHSKAELKNLKWKLENYIKFYDSMNSEDMLDK